MLPIYKSQLVCQLKKKIRAQGRRQSANSDKIIAIGSQNPDADSQAKHLTPSAP